MRRHVSFAVAGSSAVRAPLSSSAIPGLERLWGLTKGDPQVTIAVLDGPVDVGHPCFAGATLQTVVDDRQPAILCRGSGDGSCTHGTQIASLLFAQHGTGPVWGVAPGCRGLIIPIFRSNAITPGGVLPASQAELARAIDLAREHGAHVINVSAGQRSVNGRADPELAAAVRRCTARGILIVSAAGNDGCDCLHVPAALPGVLVVGALDASGRPATFSNYGPSYRAQGLLAPGQDLPVAVAGGGFGVQSGTSYSSPLIAGVVALLLSLPRGVGNSGGAINALQVRDLLLKGARPCGGSHPDVCRRYLAGTVDVHRALTLLQGGERLMSMPNSTDQTPQPGPSDPMEPEGAADIAGTRGQTGSDQAAPPQPEIRAAGLPAAPGPRPRPGAAPAQVRPSCGGGGEGGGACGCGGGEGKCSCGGGNAAAARPPLVYALGSLSYDFGSQARFDAIAGEIGVTEGLPLPVGPIQASIDTGALLDYLMRAPYAAESIIWTLNLDATPLYAIRPDGAFAMLAYERLRQFLADQVDPKQRAERVAIPGYLAGSATLLTGQKVGVVVPELRGMFNWTLKALVDRTAGKDPGDKAPKAERDEYRRKRDGITNFMQRVYYEVRNLGLEPRERALNFAATNAFAIARLFGDAAGAGLQLDQIDVERSPICRLDADCWDVVLYFFNPANVLGEARHAYRFAVDVSDVVPVMLGDIREWSVR